MGLNLILAVATFAAVVNTATAANGTIDFALMGVQKAGTTFLSKQVLAKHPMVYLNTKEIHFWDHCQPLPDACSHNWTQLLDDGIAAHKKSFLTAPVPQNCSLDKWVASLHSHPKDRLWGDKTPIYVSMPYIAHQISVTAPNIKLMVTLRNPVDRAYSGFEMDQQHTRNRIEKAHGKKGLVKGAWYDAAIPSAKAFAKILKRLESTNKHTCTSEYLELYEFLYRGMYADQLQYWLQLFPPEQLLIMESEYLWKTQDYSQVDKFLSLTPSLEKLEGNKLEHIENGKGWANNHKSSPMTNASRAILEEVYKPANKRLCKLLKAHGYECPSWASSE